jgi:hypothetical protein
MPVQELQIYGLWAGKQSAKGTANAAPARRFKQVAGGFAAPARDDGSEAYSDGSFIPDAQDWVNSLVGNGTPGVHATPEELAWLWWAFEGGETTAAVTGPPAKTKHTTTPLPGLGHWLTFATRRGSSVVDRLQHNDCMIGQMQVEGSTANKAVRVTPTILSLDPAEQRAADPAAVMPTKGAFLYTDGAARFTIDGTTFRGHSQFTFTVNKDLQPVYGDSETVYDFAIGNVQVTIGVTLFFDTDGRAQWNKIVYGSAAPAAGTKPARFITGIGSYAFDLRARDATGAVTGDKFTLTVPKVKWAVPEAPDPNAAGGVAEMALAGAMRKPAPGTEAYTITVDCDAAAFTA